MNTSFFVENVQNLCQVMGVSISKACRESGVGETLMDNVKRGRIPSIDRIQLLAQYLGTTTSELLGEEKAPSPAADDSEERLLILYRKLNQEGRDKLLDYADDLAESGKYKKVSALRVGAKEV